MKNSEIVARFNFAVETQNKEVSLFLFDLLKESANAAVASQTTENISEVSDIVYDAQVARVALRVHGASEDMFSDCNF